MASASAELFVSSAPESEIRPSFLPPNMYFPVGRPEYPSFGLKDPSFDEEQSAIKLNPNQELIASDWDTYLGPEANVPHVLSQARRKSAEFRDAVSVNSTEAVKHAVDMSIILMQMMNRYGRDLNEHVLKKMIIRESEKYPPDFVAELRARGLSSPDSMAHLKSLYKIGQKYEFLGVELSAQEEAARNSSGPKFNNSLQEMDHKWQKMAFGTDLGVDGRVRNVMGEVDEFLEEFDKKNINVDDMSDEAADVMIALFGYFSVKGIDFDEAFLSRIVYLRHEKYASLGKKKKHHEPLARAMRQIDRNWRIPWSFDDSLIPDLKAADSPKR